MTHCRVRACRRILRLDLEHLPADGRRRAALGHGDRHDRLKPVGRARGRELRIGQPEDEDRAVADQRGDAALAGAPAFVDDVRVVDDEQVGAPTEHMSRVPQGRGRVPLGQDRGVLRHGREDRIDERVGASILASIGGAPVRDGEPDREREDGHTDEPGGAVADAAKLGRRARFEQPRESLQPGRRAERQHEPRHEQVMLEPQVGGPHIDVRHEDRDAQQAEGRAPADQHDQADRTKERQHGRGPLRKDVPEHRQGAREFRQPVGREETELSAELATAHEPHERVERHGMVVRQWW